MALALLVALMPGSLSAQKNCKNVSGADILAMPDNKTKFDALNSFIRSQSNPDTLETYINAQYILAQKLGDKRKVMLTLMNRGYAFGRTYEYDKAVSAYEDALTYAKEIKDTLNIANCYKEMAKLLTRTNEYDRASEYFNRALHGYVDIGDTAKITDVYRNMGKQCIDFHLYKTARSYIDNAFRLDSASGNSKALVLDFYHTGMSDYKQYLDLDSIDMLFSGIQNTRQAVSIVTKFDEKRMLQGCYEQLMLMYISTFTTNRPELVKKAKDSAHYYYKLTSALRDQLNPMGDHIVLEITDANFHTMDGKYNEAIQLLGDIEEKFRQGGTRYMRYRSLLYRSMIWTLRQAGDYKGAVEYAEKFKAEEEATYSREFALRSIKASAETEYSELIRKREKKEHEQELEQQEQIKRQRMTTMFYMLGTILAIVFIVIILRNLAEKRRNNELLAQQKAEILKKNNELQVQNRKIVAQRDEIMEQRDEIEAQRTQLSEANSRITASIRYAQRIQTASVPSNDMMQKIFGNCMVYWRPLNIVSGDFFWATQAGKYKLLTAADCTGHGVPGAFMSMLGVSTLNDIAAQRDIENEGASAAEILEELRDKIIAALRQSGPQRETADGIDMAFCIIDTEKMELQFAGANRPLWLVRSGELFEYRPDKMPVGYHATKSSPFTNHTIAIQLGDVIYLGSDGLSDQFGGPDAKNKFGPKRLRELLASIAQMPFDEQQATIEKTFDEWRHKADGTIEPQLDDQILIGIRI